MRASKNPLFVMKGFANETKLKATTESLKSSVAGSYSSVKFGGMGNMTAVTVGGRPWAVVRNMRGVEFGGISCRVPISYRLLIIPKLLALARLLYGMSVVSGAVSSLADISEVV